MPAKVEIGSSEFLTEDSVPWELGRGSSYPATPRNKWSSGDQQEVVEENKKIWAPIDRNIPNSCVKEKSVKLSWVSPDEL